MKINGSNVIGHDEASGMLICEDGQQWYLGASNVEIDNVSKDDIPKELGIDYVKEGMTADDLVKLRSAGII